VFEPVDRPLELADPSIAFGDLELPASALLCQLLVSGVSGARSFLAKDVRDEVTEDPFVGQPDLEGKSFRGVARNGRHRGTGRIERRHEMVHGFDEGAGPDRGVIEQPDLEDLAAVPDERVEEALVRQLRGLRYEQDEDPSASLEPIEHRDRFVRIAMKRSIRPEEDDRDATLADRAAEARRLDCLVGDPLGKQQMGPKVDRPWRQVDKPVEVGEIWTQQVDEAHQRPPARLV
jgi:hypothetical protein